jgi:transcriptional regulator with XRE-family HTH domain
MRPIRNPLSSHVADRIRTLRLTHPDGLSQEDLAKAIGVATNTVSRWETGTYRPRVEDLDALARYFGVSVQEFFPDARPSADDGRLGALLRAAKNLDAEDLDELRRFAEFRQASARYRKKAPASRAPKA